jgi:hypothetical protein
MTILRYGDKTTEIINEQFSIKLQHFLAQLYKIEKH